MNRREALRTFLTGLAQTAGTVLLASSAVRGAAAQEPTSTQQDVKKRAEQLGDLAEQANGDEQFASFLNFRNGGFHNGFTKTVFGNGGFHNGGFLKTVFRNH